MTISLFFQTVFCTSYETSSLELEIVIREFNYNDMSNIIMGYKASLIDEPFMQKQLKYLS